MSTRRSLPIVITTAAVTALLTTAVPAVAKAGDELILGVKNESGSKTTELETEVADGPTLKFRNTSDVNRAAFRADTECPTTDRDERKKCPAPQATNSSGWIKFMNVDYVDGLDASDIIDAASDAKTLNGKTADELLDEASDADTLDGYEASEMLDQAAVSAAALDSTLLSDSDTADVSVDQTDVDVDVSNLELTVDVPAGEARLALVTFNASGFCDTNNAFVLCDVVPHVDGVNYDAEGYSHLARGENGPQSGFFNGGSQWVIGPLEPGVHTIGMRARASSENDNFKFGLSGRRSLTAVVFPA